MDAPVIVFNQRITVVIKPTCIGNFTNKKVDTPDFLTKKQQIVFQTVMIKITTSLVELQPCKAS